MEGKKMMRLKSGMKAMRWLFLVAALILCGFVTCGWCDQSDYYGTYAGSFSGDDHGIWVAVITSDFSDSVFLSYSTDSGTGDGGYVGYIDESGTVGHFMSYSQMFGTMVDGYIDASDGSVSGTWDNASSSASGTLTGSAVTSCAYAGSYSGTFGGDASGTWSITIDDNGYATGTMTSSGGTGTFKGGCHPDGHVIVFGQDGYGYNFAVYGQISGSSISGEWSSESGDAGTISTGTAASDSGGGGGGGCFILSLIGG